MNACYMIIIIYIYLLILDTTTSDVIINSTPSSQQVLNHFISTHARNHHRKTKLHSIMKIPLTTYKSKLILKVKTDVPFRKKYQKWRITRVKCYWTVSWRYRGSGSPPPIPMAIMLKVEVIFFLLTNINFSPKLEAKSRRQRCRERRFFL